MIAIGQSQGAIRLTPFVNAIAPIGGVHKGADGHARAIFLLTI